MGKENYKYWAYFYDQGFFGFGNSGNFKIGSLAHIIPILILIISVFLIYKYRNSFRINNKLDNKIMGALMIIMIFSELSYSWRLIYVGPGHDNVHNMLGKLPIQVCQWTLLITLCGMIIKSEDMIGTSFFLTTIPSIIAILYPTVISTTGPLYFRYYQYWFEHLTPIISIYYMFFVHDYKAKPKHIFFAWFVLSILYFIGSKANVLLDENHTNKFLYTNYIRKIPFLTNTSDLELYFVCITTFIIFSIIAYIVYRSFANKYNEKNTVD